MMRRRPTDAELLGRLQNAVALIIAARRVCNPPAMLAHAIDAAEATLFSTGRVVTDSPEARATPPGSSAGGTSADHAAAASIPKTPPTPRRQQFFPGGAP
jgi:hypothetical protein